MDISAFKRDMSPVESGRWIDDIPGFEKLRLKVRGFRSKAYEYAVSQHRQNAPRSDYDRDGIKLKHDAAERCTLMAIRDAILIDWSGITDSGADVPYNAEIAKELLFLPCPDFRDAVAWAARVVDNEAVTVSEAIEKN